jgi:hypothetical protein
MMHTNYPHTRSMNDSICLVINALFLILFPSFVSWIACCISVVFDSSRPHTPFATLFILTLYIPRNLFSAGVGGV